MLIKPSVLANKFRVNPATILHLGAHLAEERNDYLTLGWGQSEIVWIESQPNLIEKLQNLDLMPNERVMQATVWDISGVNLTFNVSNNSQSSSLFNFGTHQSNYPDIGYEFSFEVKTSRLDEIFPFERNFEFVNLDLQGAELRALIGMGTLLSKTKWVYSEVNKEQVYKGCSEIEELDSYLATFGFLRQGTVWMPSVGWGDAIWVHKSVLPGRFNRLANRILIARMNLSLQVRYFRNIAKR